MSSTVNTQRDRRFALLVSRDARVQFAYPANSELRRDQPLLDISVTGLSFGLEHELPLLVRGAVIHGAVVRVGDCDMTGKLLVKHLTRSEDQFVCGAVFYPASEMESVKLNGLIAGISAQTR
jgi:hypothetical protein